MGCMWWRETDGKAAYRIMSMVGSWKDMKASRILASNLYSKGNHVLWSYMSKHKHDSWKPAFCAFLQPDDEVSISEIREDVARHSGGPVWRFFIQHQEAIKLGFQ